jgi:hypothetical protein
LKAGERVHDHGGGQDIFKGHGFAVLGDRVFYGMAAVFDRDPGKLFSGGAEFLHVAHGA